jgi:hypothetical protein
MIDLKEVARMAKEDAEDRKLCSRPPEKGPGDLQWLVDASLEQMETMTEDLARKAAANSTEPVQ